MKQFFFLFVLLPSVAGSLMAQDSTTEKPDILNARIMTRQGRLTNGYLYSIADTTLLLSWEKRLPRMYDTTTTHGIRSFGYRDLEYVTIYRRGSTGRCILIGFAIGALSGVIAGYASGDDPQNMIISFTAGEKAIGLGLFGGAIGTITGLIVGIAGHRTFIINGKKEKFMRMSQKLAARLGQ